jgi:hypothetical protein
MNHEQILRLLEPYVPTLVESVRGAWEELRSIPLETRSQFTRCARAGVVHSLATTRLSVAFVGDDHVCYVEEGLLRVVHVSGDGGAVLLRVKKLDENLRASNVLVLDYNQSVWDFGEPIKAVVTLGYTVAERELESYLNEIYLQEETTNGKLWDKPIWRADSEAPNAVGAVSPEQRPGPVVEVRPGQIANKNPKKASS